jgi:phage-related protein
VKRIEWAGTSLDVVRAFPETARQQIGYQLYRVQCGLDPSDWKAMNSVGPNVREIRVHIREEYRVIYVATFEEAVHVLHAFTKKSRKTPKRDLSLATARFSDLIKKQKAKKS